MAPTPSPRHPASLSTFCVGVSTAACLEVDRTLRRICGWERRSDIPSESTFSRAFAAETLPERVHEQLIREGLRGRIVGHIARDATEIEARERPSKRPPEPPASAPPAAPPDPASTTTAQPMGKAPTRLERQREQSLEQMLADLPSRCDVGTKTNSQGFKESWIGYKLDLDVADGRVPVSAVLTAASTHDRQAALPLARKSAGRVVWLYDLMDSAYDAAVLIEDIQAAGRVPIVDHNTRRNTRRNTGLRADINGERKRRQLIRIPDPDDLRYRERTNAQRANGRLKDEFGGRTVRVRGPVKVFCHLMFGVAVLAADSLLRLFSRPPQPA